MVNIPINQNIQSPSGSVVSNMVALATHGCLPN